MSERADLGLLCEHGRFGKHATYPDRSRFCDGGRPITPAEALTVLLPDVDWEALREAMNLPTEGYVRGDLLMAAERVAFEAARRLLAVYDGKDEG